VSSSSAARVTETATMTAMIATRMVANAAIRMTF